MNCREAGHHIAAGPDGSLGNDQRAALEQHVAACAGCRRLREDLAATLDTWRSQAQNVPVPDSTREWEAVRRSIRQGGTTGAKGGRHFLSWIALPLGAAAALMLTLWMDPVTPPAPAPAPSVGRSGDSVEVSAADGSVVFVDDKSGWVVIWEAQPPARQI
jgi:hypothetical protein